MTILEGLALLGAGLLGLIIEIFVPAGGVIGIAGGGAIITAVILSYVQGGSSVGIIILAAALVLTPATIMIAFKFFPATPLGKRIILGTTLGSGDEASDSNGKGEPARHVAPGAVGTTITALRPTGVATIDGVRLSVLTGGEYVAPQTDIEVVKVEGNRILVREA